MTGTHKTLHVKTCIRDVTTAGTREKFLNAQPDYYKIKAITIRANADNAGNVYFGGSNLVSNADYHFILGPGETIDISVLEADKRH